MLNDVPAPLLTITEVKDKLAKMAANLDKFDTVELLDGVLREIASIREWQHLVDRNLCLIGNELTRLETLVSDKRKLASQNEKG